MSRVTTPTASPRLAIDTRALTKTYGTRTVVDNIDLRVPAGTITGFIGRNGAGKTTTMRMLLGLIRPTSGSATVLGHPLDHPRDFLPRVGALIETPLHCGPTRSTRCCAQAGGHPAEP